MVTVAKRSRPLGTSSLLQRFKIPLVLIIAAAAFLVWTDTGSSDVESSLRSSIASIAETNDVGKNANTVLSAMQAAPGGGVEETDTGGGSVVTEPEPQQDAGSMSADGEQPPPAQDEPAQVQPRSVALIQGGGYLGASINEKLSESDFQVSVFDDRSRVDSSLQAQLKAVQDITKEDLKTFGSVIYLADPVTDSAGVVSILEKLVPAQHFITVSSANVVVGTLNAKEDVEIDSSKISSECALVQAMYNREQDITSYYGSNEMNSPKISILRLGSVAGLSPSQRTDGTIHSMFVSAYTSGVIDLPHGNKMQSFLAMDDFTGAVAGLLSAPGGSDNMKVWHLASFSANTFKVAASVASLTSARVGTVSATESPGSSLDTAAFTEAFNFPFSGSIESILELLESNVPSSITPAGPYELIDDDPKNMACPVCGSRNHQLVLDIGQQPFANDFQKDVQKALDSPRFPLKLIRCKVCNHLHLSHLASRDDLFDHYLYQSATSRTLAKYFDWLSQKIMKESGVEKGNILEIACNDGTQLNFFKQAGWNTYGVDPAANIVPLAQKQGHEVKVGYWGADLDFPELPTGDDLTAIVAQNVYAHVPDNVAFLKKCVDVMGPKTKVYLQTSQCHMHQFGQFDTAYHEHVSFFTGHSFQRAAELAGLVVTEWLITPIHGTSCLVTMMLPGEPQKAADNSVTLNERLNQEVNEGITSDYFYQRYEARAHQTRRWIVAQLNHLREDGYQIISYGAAAKGMVLLHFFMESPEAKTIDIEYILDDAPLKQDTYCAGTRIPVRPTASLKENTNPSKPTVVLVLAWNFWAEIAENIKRELQGHKTEVLALLPFPTPRLVRLRMDAADGDYPVLLDMPFFPANIPNPLQKADRRKAIMMFDLCNEEPDKLQEFVAHHAHMFDFAIAQNSCDHASSQILVDNAPFTWRIVKTADEVDAAVKENVAAGSQVWGISLSTKEFIVQSRFRQELMALEGSALLRLHELCVVAGDAASDKQPYFFDKYFNSTETHQIKAATTAVEVPAGAEEGGEVSFNGFIAKFGCQQVDELSHSLSELGDPFAKEFHAVTF